jgi:site-specific recombinase XerD
MPVITSPSEVKKMMSSRSLRLDDSEAKTSDKEVSNSTQQNDRQQVIPASFVRFHDEFAGVASSPALRESEPALAYLASLAPSGRRTMRTRLEYIAELLTGRRTLHALPWEKLRYEHVVAIRALLQERKLAPASINATLYAIRGVAKAAWNMSLMSAEDYARIRNVKPSHSARLPAGRSVASDELSALLEACAKDLSPAGTRDAALLGVLYCGGLRRSEVASLNVEDFDPDSGALKVIGQSNKERLVYIMANAAQALNDWLNWRGASAFAQELESTAAIEVEQGIVAGSTPGPRVQPLFCPVRKNGRIQIRRMTDQAIYLVLQKRAMEAHIARCSPHDLRRTFISDLLDRDIDIVTVQELAGHANASTTARYDRRGERAKQAAASSLHLPYRKADSLADSLVE